MKHSIDRFLAKGSSHKICEDYVQCGLLPFPYCVLSDGCSGATDTDVGARILTYHAIDHLNSRQPLWGIETQRKIAAKSLNSARGLGISEDCLFATLMIIIDFEDKFYVHAWGDGNIGINFKDGNKSLYNIDQGTTPTYLHYYNHPELNHNFSSSVKEVLGYENPDVFQSFGELNFNLLIPKDLVNSVTVFSDGIETYSDVTIDQAAEELLNYKSFHGEFVQKRMNVIERRKKWTHYDDVSAVGISIIQEESDA